LWWLFGGGKFVLTAAHCRYTYGDVRVGSRLYNGPDESVTSPGVERSVELKIKHPGFTGNPGLVNDFMILVLNENVNSTLYPPADLNFIETEPTPSSMLTTIGFGTVEYGGDNSDTLQKVDVPVVSYDVCRRQYGDVINEQVHLCAGFENGLKDACQGDSGGPIFKKLNGAFVQFGVVSWGRGCAQADRSGIYARVSGAQDWLVQTICSLRKGDFVPRYCEGYVVENNDDFTDDDGFDIDATNNDDGIDDDGFDDDGFDEERDDAVTQEPTKAPTKSPTKAPTKSPTKAPTKAPTTSPTTSPTKSPTSYEGKIVESGFELESDSLFTAGAKRLEASQNAHSGSFYALIRKAKKLSSSFQLGMKRYSEVRISFHYKIRNVDSFFIDFNYGTEWVEEVEINSSANTMDSYQFHSLTATIRPNEKQLKFRFRSTGTNKLDRLLIDDVTFVGIKAGNDTE